MFSRIRAIAIFACIGIGMGVVPKFVWAHSPNPSRDWFAVLRPNKSPMVSNSEASNGTAAISYHRLAKNYVEQNDVSRASTNYSLALQNAAPKQVAGIASDYAAFLTDIGDLRKAELILRQALTQSPNDVEIIRMLARCLVQQDKVIEGRRHFLTIGSESEANAEIVAIYRKQGDTEKLAAVEQKWGSASPKAVRPDPVLIAATPRPVAPRPAVVTVVRPEPVSVAAVARPVAPLLLPSAARSLPSAPVSVATPDTDVAPKKVTVIAAEPVASPLSRSEFFDNRVPIPVPRFTPQLVVSAAKSPSPAQGSPVPVPAATQPAPERLVLMNPVRLATAPKPVLSEAKVKEPPRPAVAVRPRRHYVVNTRTSTDLEALLPGIRPVSAVVPPQNTQ